MNIEVCYTPELIHQFELEGKVVVVIDVLRATSCMVAGLSSGIDRIKPVASIEECLELGKRGYKMAGERGGEKVAEFDLGNSPFEYMEEQLKGKKVATTTTNGTRAISLSKAADKVLIGAFLNLGAIVRYLSEEGKDIVLFCAGWKGRYNLEDSLFAGAVCDQLSSKVSFTDDATLSAMHLYRSMSSTLSEFILQSNHAERLSNFGITKDLAYCSMIDVFDQVPFLNQEGELQV